MFVAIRVAHVRSLRRFDSCLQLHRMLAVIVVVVGAMSPERAGLTLRSGDIVVSYSDRESHGIARLDIAGGTLTTISNGGQLTDATDLDAAADGTIYATNARRLLRIDPRTGAQQVVSSDGLIDQPNSMVLRGN